MSEQESDKTTERLTRKLDDLVLPVDLFKQVLDLLWDVRFSPVTEVDGKDHYNRRLHEKQQIDELHEQIQEHYKAQRCCKHCNDAPVELIEGNYPYDVDHWMCIKCDSTFPISEYGQNKQDDLTRETNAN